MPISTFIHRKRLIATFPKSINTSLSVADLLVVSVAATLEADLVAVHGTDDQLCRDAHLVRAELSLHLEATHDVRDDALLLHDREALAYKEPASTKHKWSGIIFIRCPTLKKVGPRPHMQLIRGHFVGIRKSELAQLSRNSDFRLQKMSKFGIGIPRPPWS